MHAGDYVVLDALEDVVVVMSACPQDVLSIVDPCAPGTSFEVGTGQGVV